MSLHFIVNELAGNGKSKANWTIIQNELQVPYTAHITTAAKDAIAIAANLKQQAEQLKQTFYVVGIGGDGTMNEIIQGVAGSSYIILGAVKGGSGNDFSRYYSTFQSASQIEAFLKAPVADYHDVGQLVMANEQIKFINNSGIGFDAFVAITANESKLKKRLNRFNLGKLSYVYYVVKGLFQFKPFELTAVVDGAQKHYEKVWFATVSNQSYFGGGMNLTPQSNSKDGLLELTVVSGLSKWKFLAVFGTVFFAKHTRYKEVFQVSASTIQLHTAADLLCHTDGEKQTLQAGNKTLEYTAQRKMIQIAK